MTARKEQQQGAIGRWNHTLNRVTVSIARKTGEREAIEAVRDLPILDYNGLRAIWKRYYPEMAAWF